MTYQSAPSANQNKMPNLNFNNADKSKLKIVGFAVSGVIALIVIALLLLKLLSGIGYKSVVKAYLDENYKTAFCGEKIDEKKVSKRYPKFMAEVIDEYIDRMDDTAEAAEDRLDNLIELLDMDDDLKWEDFCNYSYEIEGSKKLSDKKLKDYEDEISEYDNDIKVQSGYRVTIKPKYEFKFPKKVEKEIEDNLDDIDDVIYDEDIDDIDDLYKYLNKSYKHDNFKLIVLKCNGKTGVWTFENSSKNERYIWDGLESWNEELYD